MNNEKNIQMKLAVGMGSIDDYEAYAEAGADEIFVGYVPRRWQEKYGLTTPLNRREVCFYHVQAGSRSEMEILSAKARRQETKGRPVPVTVAFNGLHFREEQLPVIADIMEECLEMGFSSVIVADLGLLVYLHECGLAKQLKIHISGEFGEIDHWMLRELYRLGARRLIFHRKVSLSSMKAIIRKQREWEKTQNVAETMEFEAFILNENCHFNGAFCNTIHSDDLIPMCRMPYQVTKIKGEGQEELDRVKRTGNETDGRPENETENDHDYDHDYDYDYDYDYGLASVDRMAEMGVTHLKIVGRGASPELMVRSIQKAKACLSQCQQDDAGSRA